MPIDHNGRGYVGYRLPYWIKLCHCKLFIDKMKVHEESYFKSYSSKWYILWKYSNVAGLFFILIFFHVKCLKGNLNTIRNFSHNSKINLWYLLACILQILSLHSYTKLTIQSMRCMLIIMLNCFSWSCLCVRLF